MSQFYDDLDTIDAAVFSGDVLETRGNRDLLKQMAKRWLRAVAELEAREDDQACDRQAEQLTAAALGTGEGRINPSATSVDDIFDDPKTI